MFLSKARDSVKTHQEKVGDDVIKEKNNNVLKVSNANLKMRKVMGLVMSYDV